MKKYIALWLSMTTILMATAQQAPSLKELVDSAIARDENLANQLLQVESTLLDKQALSNAYLPELNISGKAGFLASTLLLRSPEIVLPLVSQPLPILKNTFNNTSFIGEAKAEAKVLLYSGGKVGYLKKAVEEKANAERAITEKDKQQLLAEVAKVYDQFALLHQTKMVLDEAAKRLALNKLAAEKALSCGLITKYEYQKMEIAQAQLASKRATYEYKKTLLVKQLEILTGIESCRLAQIQHGLTPIIVDTTQTDIQQRAELLAMEATTKALDYKIKAEQTWWIPKVQAVTNLFYIGLYDTHIKSKENMIPKLPIDTRMNWSIKSSHVLPLFQVGVGFSWTIMDKNESKHAVEKLRIEKRKIANQQTDVMRKLSLNIEKNKADYTIANTQITLKAKEKALAESAWQQAEKEFKYGTIKSTQLVEAENDMEQANLAYLQAIFEQRRVAIELLMATQSLTVESIHS